VVRYRWDTVGSKLDERGRRMFAANLRWSLGSPGLPVRPSIATRTIWTARNYRRVSCGVHRRPQGGRCKKPGRVPALKRLLEPATLGDPMRPLLWDKLAAILDRRNVEVEQDRAPPVLPYHAEPERPPADGSHCRRRTSNSSVRRRPDQGSPEGRVRARRANLRKRHQSPRYRNGRLRPHRRCVPSGMELYNQTCRFGIAVLRSPPSTATLPALG
jgi:hypothetical protein